MPPADDIQRQLVAAWQLMNGRREAMRLLDVSADGFWNSFFAILVAMPVLVVGWVPLANAAFPDSTISERIGVMVRIAMVDIGAWVLPIVVLALVARHIGIRDRFVHFVVASNWGSALFAWFMLPASLLRLVFPGTDELALVLSLGIFLASLVLSWRLTNASLEKGPGVASGVFGAMLLASLLVLFALQDLLGVAPVQ
ncbi:transporter [Mesorhizobium sp. CAU 1741]|uniref:transporter n=1 Tax=Mesorhizobium sp. CAU 1741 TaxID=3140366 RepID=UPI00325B0D69